MKAGSSFLWSLAAFTLTCLSAEAVASGVATPNNSQTYSTESIALAVGGNTVAIQGNNFFYSVLGTTLMPPGDAANSRLARCISRLPCPPANPQYGKLAKPASS